MKGGKREGAGRKKGSLGKKTREIAEKAAKSGITPLEYMLKVMRSESADPERRDAMARAAAPYIHPRLEAIAVSGPNGGPIETKDLSMTDIARRLAFLLTAGAEGI